MIIPQLPYAVSPTEPTLEVMKDPQMQHAIPCCRQAQASPAQAVRDGMPYEVIKLTPMKRIPTEGGKAAI